MDCVARTTLNNAYKREKLNFYKHQAVMYTLKRFSFLPAVSLFFLSLSWFDWEYGN